MSTSRLIKHSVRTVRKPCKHCGTTDLYWGHDPDVSGSATCTETACASHGQRVSWVLCNRDMTRHACRTEGYHVPPTVTYDEVTTTEPVEAPKPTVTAPNTEDVAAQLASLLGSLAPTVDVSAQLDAFRTEMNERIATLSVPLVVSVKRDDTEPVKITGTCHKVMPKVLATLQVGEHVFLTGGAGAGKTTIAEQCAEALDVPYFGMSLSPQTPTSAVFGYMQATGDYVRTPYRDAFEHGGVFLLDEIDTAHPAVLAGINMSLANGSGAFPDGMVKRHPSFRCVAAGNTVGRGADRTYVGRQALDGATLDRFTVLHVDVDEALERTLCLATGLEADKVLAVLGIVRAVRANITREGLPVTASPRASVGICRLITSGAFTLPEAVDARLRKGMSDQDWNKITSGVVISNG